MMNDELIRDGESEGIMAGEKTDLKKKDEGVCAADCSAVYGAAEFHRSTSAW